MKQKPRSIGRGFLVRKLREHGMSRRGAVLVLNGIFKEMRAALARGEEVEFPFGKLERVAHKHRQQEGHFLDKVRMIYKKPFTVAHATDEAGEKLLKPKPEPRKLVWPRRPVFKTDQ